MFVEGLTFYIASILFANSIINDPQSIYIAIFSIIFGLYYLIVKTDALNNVDEFDETNNTQTFFLKVRERPSSSTSSEPTDK